MKSDCPYCSLATTRGELFCSKHSPSMKGLKSGVFFIHEQMMEECDWHITRLSLNFNLDGPQTYFAGNREYRINPGKYLVINEGQSFKTSADAETPNRMVTVAFEVGLPEKIFHTLTTSSEFLLDHPFDHPKFSLFEKTYDVDEFFHNKIHQLITPIHKGQQDDESLEEVFEELLIHLFHIQQGIQREMASINKSKASTRVEIYKRLNWALEYANNNFNTDLTVETLAAQACLSSFHFKRLFKSLFHESPYQYVKRLRLEKASELLAKGHPVREVCTAVGWKNVSSFIRLFKETRSVTPARYAEQLS